MILSFSAIAGQAGWREVEADRQGASLPSLPDFFLAGPVYGLRGLGFRLQTPFCLVCRESEGLKRLKASMRLFWKQNGWVSLRQSSKKGLE